MPIVEILKAVLFGVVEGITEWLPISSTGHMILLNEFVKLNVSEEFWNLFLVVIQLGAILAVGILYWKTIWPFKRVKTKQGGSKIKFRKQTFILWLKALVACIPAGVVGVLADDWLDEHFFNWKCVSLMLILVGICFLIIETLQQWQKPVVTRLSDITYKDALIIGIFQLIAAVFPGTSRSGATILGGLILGISRTAASRFTFILAIPVMAGASLLKLIKNGMNFTGTEWVILLVGMFVAFVVSMLVIGMLMNYIRRHNFKVFGWYRIILGIIVVVFFLSKDLGKAAAMTATVSMLP